MSQTVFLQFSLEQYHDLMDALVLAYVTTSKLISDEQDVSLKTDLQQEQESVLALMGYIGESVYGQIEEEE